MKLRDGLKTAPYTDHVNDTDHMNETGGANKTGDADKTGGADNTSDADNVGVGHGLQAVPEHLDVAPER